MFLLRLPFDLKPKPMARSGVFEDIKENVTNIAEVFKNIVTTISDVSVCSYFIAVVSQLPPFGEKVLSYFLSYFL